MTVTRWCESGKLAAIPKPYGHKTAWRISPQALASLQTQEREAKQEKAKPKRPHADYLAGWERAMAKGLIAGRAFSARTIGDYRHYAGLYFAAHRAVSVEGLKAELMRIPARQFAKREHYYKALVCLAKFLIREGALEEGFLADVKPLFPRRHLPPKRTSVTEDGLTALLTACDSPQDRLIVTLLAETGVRASEACAIRVAHIDFEQGRLSIPLGKGGKARKVGLNDRAIVAIGAALEARPCVGKDSPLLPNRHGRPMDASGLYQRLERIGKRARVKVSPHALRRAFVTINASKGRPLPLIQRACGHSSIKTTESYCLIEQEAVIEAMRGW